MTGQTKLCRSCLRDLPVEEFNLRWKDRTTRQSYCRECMIEAVRTTRAMQREARRG